MRHHRIGRPERVLQAALARLEEGGVRVICVAAAVVSAPLGPSRRRYANSAAVIACDLSPPALLARLKEIERALGRRAAGQRWSARVLDLDVVLWDGGSWAARNLVIPHPQFRRRGFVLAPARQIAANWRDPATGLTIAQLHHRLTRSKPTPR